MLTFQSNQETRHQKCTSIIGDACNNYTIVNQEEIRKKLNYLFSKNALLTIKVPGKFATSTLLTTITHIEKNHIFLDGFQNERFNKDLLKQNTLVVSANLEGIAVSFILNELSGHDTDGTFTLTAPLPQSMEWVQRRNARRVKVPINIPVKIQYKNQTEYFNVADISIAGLSYIDQTEDHYFSVIGGLHTDCNIVLPDKSIHLACFEIVNNITIPYKHTKQINRVGCEIKRASYRLDTALQHLINQIDFYYQ
ncbi:MAG TPA: flagellar regulator YcgR PilZN domain-containing protein [Methylobacter sp.]|jgi:hypothetical protein